MKKTNFIVVFWLLLALISFVVFVMNFSSFWRDISFWIISNDQMSFDGMKKEDALRNLIQVVPMIILSIVVFVVGIKQGMKNYNKI